MTSGTSNILKKSAQAAAVLCPALFAGQSAQAEDFTASVFMREYDSSERSLFLAGLIEGLAQARYERDDKDSAGAVCIYDWFYGGGDDVLLQIYGAFASNGNSAPAALVSALVKRECPS